MQINLRPSAFLFVGVFTMALVLVVSVGSFFLGYVSSSFWSVDLPRPQAPVVTGAPPTLGEGMGQNLESDWDRWERKLAVLRRRQTDLETQLRSKSAEAESRARTAEQLRAELHFQERELSFLRERVEQLARQKSGFVHGETEYEPGPGAARGPRGFRLDDGLGVRAATAAQSFPAELIIELSPPNPLPGDPYLLSIRIHNSGNRSFGVQGLAVVWKIAGRNAGGSVAFEPRRVHARSTVTLHEARGVWLEAFDTARIVVTADLTSGGRLRNTLSRSGP